MANIVGIRRRTTQAERGCEQPSRSLSAPNGSTSFDVLQVNDMVYVSYAHYPLGRYDVNAPYAKDPARRTEYRHEGRVRSGKIEGRHIRWAQDVDPGFTPDYCNLVQDQTGYFWIFTRENQYGTAHRSRHINDVRTWEPESICLPVQGRHALDAAALDGGRLYVVSLLTSDGKLYGNLYDGEDWDASPVLIADDLTTVPGDDRRLAVEFDPTEKRLHLIYVDAGNRLRYRHLDSPYGQSDWQPGLSLPGLEIAAQVFTAALSVDSSSKPYGLVITYGKEKILGPGPAPPHRRIVCPAIRRPAVAIGSCSGQSTWHPLQLVSQREPGRPCWSVCAVFSVHRLGQYQRSLGCDGQCGH